MPMISRAAFATLLAPAALMAALATASAESTPAAPGASPDASAKIQRWAATRASMLDARLAGLKAGLKLTPDQDKLWAPFEAAVREFAEARMAHMQQAMERAEKDDEEEASPPPSPIDRLDRMATRLSDVGGALRKIADAGKPLYASFDDQQKRMFGFLSHEMMKMGRGHGGFDAMMGPPRHHHDDEDNSDDEQ